MGHTYTEGMPKRTSKKSPSDINLLALSVIRAKTGTRLANGKVPQKNPAAVLLGRLGGIKGGKARAEKLTPKERSKIARKAARARWGKGER